MRLSLRPGRLFMDYRAITAEYLQNKGIRLLLCDLDYTLAPRCVKEPDETVQHWIASLHEAGITVMIVSNNRNPARVERFCAPLGIPYEGHAGKPGTRGIRHLWPVWEQRRVKPLCWGINSSPICWRLISPVLRASWWSRWAVL